jgi:hypothetical protein
MNSAASVVYNDIVGNAGRQTVLSDTLSKYFLAAAVLCQVRFTTTDSTYYTHYTNTHYTNTLLRMRNTRIHTAYKL